MSAPTAVVHLAWAPLGIEPFEAFLASYARHPAGAEHELVLLFNGFADAAALAPYRERVADLAAREIVLPAPCQDLAAYAEAAARLEHERICVLNSYSVLLGDGWLRLLCAPLDDPATGATAATASWASMLGYSLWQAGLGGAYGSIFADRRRTAAVMHEVSGLRCPSPRSLWIASATDALRHARAGTLFPAAHLRTNGLAIRRTDLAELTARSPATKQEAYNLESGRRSLTSQLRRRGLATLLVDRHGVARAPAQWPRADVFWQGDQRDLLVSDNQTRIFDAASEQQRDVLRRYAWGPQARRPSG